MASGRSTYVAKKAATQVNPITNDAIFLQSDSSSLAAFVAVPEQLVSGTSGLDGKMFYVRASGKVTTGTSSTLIVTLYYSAAARTQITLTGATTTGATVTTGSIATTNGNWMIAAEFLWDQTSKQLNGAFEVLSSPTPTYGVWAAATQITAVDLSVAGAGFVVGTHFGSTNASNVATLSEFILEVM